MAISRSERVNLTPKRALDAGAFERDNLGCERAYSRPGMAILRSSRGNLRPGKAYLGHGLANLRPVMVNMRSGRTLTWAHSKDLLLLLGSGPEGDDVL